MTGGSQNGNGQPGTHKVHDSCIGHLPLCSESGSKAPKEMLTFSVDSTVRRTHKRSKTHCSWYQRTRTPCGSSYRHQQTKSTRISFASVRKLSRVRRTQNKNVLNDLFKVNTKTRLAQRKLEAPRGNIEVGDASPTDGVAHFEDLWRRACSGDRSRLRAARRYLWPVPVPPTHACACASV